MSVPCSAKENSSRVREIQVIVDCLMTATAVGRVGRQTLRGSTHRAMHMRRAVKRVIKRRSGTSLLTRRTFIIANLQKITTRIIQAVAWADCSLTFRSIIVIIYTTNFTRLSVSDGSGRLIWAL